MTTTTKRTIRVCKFGGSVLTKDEDYQKVARYIARELRESGGQIVAVVSALEGVTDALSSLAERIQGSPETKALDLLWSVGESRSAALLALHLGQIGVTATPFGPHQVGTLYEDGSTQEGDLTFAIAEKNLQQAFETADVVIVPGFFALDTDHQLRNLGRGGSDLTAVVIADTLGADRCELIKDVPGYYSCDPNIYRSAQPLEHITYGEAIKKAEIGEELVQERALRVAERCSVELEVKSLNRELNVTVVSHGQVESQLAA